MKGQAVLLPLATLAKYVFAQADTVAYTDAETGIKFQSYTDTVTNTSWRVALPLSTDGNYDVLVQIEGPSSLGWIGWAWGGTMAYNPLTLTWPNGNSVIHSSRMAYGYHSPDVFNETTYQVLKGTTVSGGNLKFTALCKGCSSWADPDGNQQSLDLTQPARLAFALSHTVVANPGDSASSFDIHDSVGHWYADLAAAKSEDFDTWVKDNTIPASNATVILRHRPIRPVEMK
ncbi:hypothetical protein PFICI_15253 [Pestalotiopsis fici W106-1]|uniref:Cellobiose dehydrogenase-like cytochrome domain-containing protein n=1 Tax=Pestalotiopsis fici (strain W106-1 / CGMCC3.15140) TaxID=1229662 RepID=W3WGP7_PESFW|nr:uncharacterized protein PFICI_15253 [Pestalotiopsis fici W106-1]ETS73078.1 hypothetical protein PFICI_15253 [Pestalotiopsis fici W106-1]